MPTRQSALKARASQEDVRRAVESHDMASLRALLHDQDPDRKRDFLAYALALSCEQGFHETVRLLLVEEGADANRSSKLLRDSEDVPPLVLAVICLSKALSTLSKPPDSFVDSVLTWPEDMSNRAQIITSLLDHEAQLHIQGPSRRNALFYVSHRNIGEIIRGNRSVTKEKFQVALEALDDDGCNALLHVIKYHDDPSVARFFIDNGADLTVVDDMKRTTLMYAIWKSRANLVQMLVRNKSVVRLTDCRSRNVWHHAAMDVKQHWDKGIIDSLFLIDDQDTSADAEDEGKKTALHYSAIYGTSEIAKLILEKSNRSLDANDLLERTPLHFAAAYGHADIANMLLNRGAEIDRRSDGKLTPLHMACACGTDDVDVVKLLLNQGAATEALTDEKMTPLHMAAAHGQSEIVKSLLLSSHKANINARSEGGWTPLHLTAWGHRVNLLDPPTRTFSDPRTKPSCDNYIEVVRVLLREGANVNQASRASKTALHLAAEAGHQDVVELLLSQRDVALALKDNEGNTPLLNAAKSEQSKHLMRLLAPWTRQSTRSLPAIVKQVAKDFDANIIDFQVHGGKPHRYHVPIFDLLYRDFIKAGTLTKYNVSTRPRHSDDGSFRWIHLPANNLSWAHALLTKHFIEDGSTDVEGFRALEQSLSQLQYRGQTIHAQHMRPTCTRLPRESESTLPPRRGRKDVRPSEPPPRASTLEVHSDDPFSPPSSRIYKRVFEPNGGNYGTQSQGRVQSSRKRHKQNRARDSSNNHDVDLVLDIPRRAKSRTPLNALNLSPQEEDSATPKHTICLFMPFLDLEHKRSVDKMHENVYSTSSSAVSAGGSLAHDNRDLRLHRADFAFDSNEYYLHVRRTLAQYRYKNIDTRSRDNSQVVWRYQQQLLKNQLQATPKRDEVDILMVDQLWIWICEPHFLVTCFPTAWEHPREKTPALLSSILEDLSPRSGRPVLNVHELAVRIVRQCLLACDGSAEEHGKLGVLDMFSSCVVNAMDSEAKTFKRFKEAIDSTEIRLDRLLSEQSFQREIATNGSKTKGVATEDLDADERFLDIRSETILLWEVKDIQDELGIVSEVLDDQLGVLQALQEVCKTALAHETQVEQETILNSGNISLSLLQQRRTEIDGMKGQLQEIYTSVVTSLELKERHASAIQARYSGIEARIINELAILTANTAQAGEVLRVFTTVTVIFLPLSFLAAFFAMNIKELPHNDQGEQQLSLAFVMKYVVGVGLGTALAIILLARYVPWAKLSWQASRAETGVKRAATIEMENGGSSSKAPRLSGFRSRLRARRPRGDQESGIEMDRLQ